MTTEALSAESASTGALPALICEYQISHSSVSDYRTPPSSVSD